MPAGQLLPVPGGCAWPTRRLPEAACTIQATVYQQARLAAGETLLVHGGGGGIGTFAIQLAKADGAMVACTAGSAEKLARCRELGADLAISYRDEDFVAAVLDFTGGAGADVILDIMGAPYLARNLAALATWGRLVIIGMQGGSRAEIDLGVMHKRASVSPPRCGPGRRSEKAAVVAAARAHVWPLISAGQVVAVIDRMLPMAEAAQAHRAGGQRAHREDPAGQLGVTPARPGRPAWKAQD